MREDVAQLEQPVRSERRCRVAERLEELLRVGLRLFVGEHFGQAGHRAALELPEAASGSAALLPALEEARLLEADRENLRGPLERVHLRRE